MLWYWCVNKFLTLLHLQESHPDEEEDVIVLQAIKDVNLTKMVPQDVPILESITADLFPSVKTLATASLDLKHYIREVCEKQNIQATDYFVDKVQQVKPFL